MFGNLMIGTEDETFDFYAVLFSHGWLRLHPFRYDGEDTLYRIQQSPNGTVIRLNIRKILHPLDGMEIGMDGIDFDPIADLPEYDEFGNEIEKEEDPLVEKLIYDESLYDVVGRIFSMDWELEELYEMLEEDRKYHWIIDERMGRMLVAPSVWEDLAKTLLTTNTTWAQTQAMNERLCSLGDEFEDSGEHAFPTPHRIATMPYDELHAHVRAGYRTEYLHDLARKIDSGEVDVESWYKSRHKMTSKEIFENVRSLKGFGDYAAGTMTRLLGKFDYIAIDTACRAGYKRATGSETATDKEIREYYSRFGEWQGLVAWLDVVRE